jgi:hypothetical protein
LPDGGSLRIRCRLATIDGVLGFTDGELVAVNETSTKTEARRPRVSIREKPAKR